MEQLLVSEEIQKFIRGDVEDINTDVIEKTATDFGMITLEQKRGFSSFAWRNHNRRGWARDFKKYP